MLNRVARQKQPSIVILCFILLSITFYFVVTYPTEDGSYCSNISGRFRTGSESCETSQQSPDLDVSSVGQTSAILNSTLGFQKIFVLSMPSRTDKRDALTVSAYASGLDLEFIDGVNGSLVSPKSYPVNWDMSEPMGSLGCWRGHLDILQRMVKERITSALIMEDDIDWDVMIKSQFSELARGTRHLLNVEKEPHSPYGDGWDIITTGHCGAWNRIDQDQEYWIIEDDPTVVAEAERTWWRKPNLTPKALSGEHTRLVFEAARFSCTASYAISLQGAARFLYDQSVLPNGKAVDLGYAAYCKRRDYGRNSCLAVYPMLTGVHKPAGDASRDSDRKDDVAGKVDIRKTARSEDLVYPVRLNLGALLKGQTTMAAQSPQLAMASEIDMSSLKLPSGRPVAVSKEEYIMEEPPKKEAVDPS